MKYFSFFILVSSLLLLVCLALQEVSADSSSSGRGSGFGTGSGTGSGSGRGSGSGSGRGSGYDRSGDNIGAERTKSSSSDTKDPSEEQFDFSTFIAMHDLDKDEKLNRGELERVIRSQAMLAGIQNHQNIDEAVAHLFAELDRDKDGFITSEELTANEKQHSDDYDKQLSKEESERFDQLARDQLFDKDGNPLPKAQLNKKHLNNDDDDDDDYDGVEEDGSTVVKENTFLRSFNDLDEDEEEPPSPFSSSSKSNGQNEGEGEGEGEDEDEDEDEFEQNERDRKPPVGGAHAYDNFFDEDTDGEWKDSDWDEIGEDGMPKRNFELHETSDIGEGVETLRQLPTVVVHTKESFEEKKRKENELLKEQQRKREEQAAQEEEVMGKSEL